MFDFDGVIADTLDIFHTAFQQAASAQGFPQFENRVRFLALFETNLYDGLRQAGVGHEAIEAILNRMARDAAGAFAGAKTMPGMPAVLNRLARSGPIYIISSNASSIISTFLGSHGIDGVADVLGADKGLSKVDKIRRVIERHSSAGVRHYYIGDTVGDVREARKAGAIPVAVCWGWHAAERLQETSPAFLLHSPEGILDLVSSKENGRGGGI